MKDLVSVLKKQWIRLAGKYSGDVNLVQKFSPKSRKHIVLPEGITTICIILMHCYNYLNNIKTASG